MDTGLLFIICALIVLWGFASATRPRRISGTQTEAQQLLMNQSRQMNTLLMQNKSRADTVAASYKSSAMHNNEVNPFGQVENQQSGYSTNQYYQEPVQTAYAGAGRQMDYLANEIGDDYYSSILDKSIRAIDNGDINKASRYLDVYLQKYPNDQLVLQLKSQIDQY
jgi:TolA-binding protein